MIWQDCGFRDVTATELFKISSDALGISGPPEWASPDVRGVRETISAAGPVYRLHGKPGNLQAYYPNSKHDFPADARKKAYEFFDKHLKRQTLGKGWLSEGRALQSRLQ